MKALTIITAMAIAMASGDQLFAQPGRPGPGGPGGPAQGPLLAQLPRPGGPGALRPMNSYQGKVVKLSSNDDFLFDGFYLINGTDSLLIKFPAHLGKQIQPLAKMGANINVSGTAENAPLGNTEIRMVSLTANGKTISDTPPTEIPTAPVEKTVDGKGKITRMQTDREGRVNGLILDNKTLLKFPPHVAGQLGNSLQAGSTLAYTGNQKTPDSGEVSMADYSVVNCNTLTINGQQYLVR